MVSHVKHKGAFGINEYLPRVHFVQPGLGSVLGESVYPFPVHPGTHVQVRPSVLDVEFVGQASHGDSSNSLLNLLIVLQTSHFTGFDPLVPRPAGQRLHSATDVAPVPEVVVECSHDVQVALPASLYLPLAHTVQVTPSPE